MLFSPEQHRKTSQLLRAKAQQESDPEAKASLLSRSMTFLALSKIAHKRKKKEDPENPNRPPAEPAKPRMKGVPPIKA